MARGRYWVNNHAHILEPIAGEEPDFWAHRIESENVAPFVTGSAQPKLTIEALMNLTITAPPTIEERQAIVRFIDLETAKVDALIAKQEQLIATLREDRTATITHAVTKGLDPKVEMTEYLRCDMVGGFSDCDPLTCGFSGFSALFGALSG